MIIEKKSCNPEATFSLAASLASHCRPNTNILLDGDLAAGKTVFARGLGSGLGVRGNIKSPTYTLMCSYEGDSMPFFHFDAYNLKGIDDFYDLGFDEFLSKDGVVLIEWASVLAGDFPDDYIHIAIKKENGDNDRTLIFTAKGEEMENILKEWQNNEDISL